MLGNDVIDLGDPETAPGSQHPRFDERVFAAGEREHLAAADDAPRRRWIFWAAKEAAFKAVRKLDPRAVFSPSCFVVDGERLVVRWQGRELRLALDVDRERVHAVATLGGPARHVLLEAVGDAGGVPAGDAVRELARSRLAASLGLSAAQITFGRRQRIPFAVAGGRRLPVDLTFSHHGRFVAFAAAIVEIS